MQTMDALMRTPQSSHGRGYAVDRLLGPTILSFLPVSRRMLAFLLFFRRKKSSENLRDLPRALRRLYYVRAGYRLRRVLSARSNVVVETIVPMTRIRGPLVIRS
jgi:hypothetical protein